MLKVPAGASLEVARASIIPPRRHIQGAAAHRQAHHGGVRHFQTACESSGALLAAVFAAPAAQLLSGSSSSPVCAPLSGTGGRRGSSGLFDTRAGCCAGKRQAVEGCLGTQKLAFVVERSAATPLHELLPRVMLENGRARERWCVGNGGGAADVERCERWLRQPLGGQIFDFHRTAFTTSFARALSVARTSGLLSV